MPQLNKDSSPSSDAPARQSASGVAEALKSLTIVRRQLPVFLAVMLCATAGGLLYLLATRSSYTAVAQMVIDSRKVSAFEQQQENGDTATIDAAAVETQAHILMSENVSLAVIKNLKLTEDPEFVPPPSAGFIGAIFNLISGTIDSGMVPSEFQLQRRTLATFQDRRKVTHVPSSYVMAISFRSYDPAKAAKIANAICNAYIDDLLAAKFQSARRASAWLQERLDNLRVEMLADSQAVADFKRKNNIVVESETGKLMNEQQMSEVNSQLISAHAVTAEAKARLDRINHVMSQDIPDAVVADAVKSEVITKLRKQYLELAAREAVWSKRYGSDHLAAASLRSEMAQIRGNIADEMRKIAENNYEIALTHEMSIQKSLDSAVAKSQITNSAQVQLRELESKAHTSRTMYENFLQRHMEAVQQQSFPVSEARLITPATPPAARSHPNTLLVLVVTAAGGMMAAFGASALREAADRTFRTGGQVENVLHVNSIVMLPFLKPVALNAADKHKDAAALANARRIDRSGNLLNYAVDKPFSEFTESLRSLKVMADRNSVVGAQKVIGFTSSLPNEGKSAIAANFASMIAHAESRVVLIDADLRNPSLSRILCPGAAAGLVEVATGQTAFDDAIWTDSRTGLTFLPAAPESKKFLHPNEILASVAIKSLIDKLCGAFDYVIVDCSPLAPVADARTTTSFIVSYIYVIEWGRTKIDVVEHSLSSAPEIYDRLLSVVLNKANMFSVQRYERFRTTYYYRKFPQYSDVT